MSESLTAVYHAFTNLPQRPAVFDREAREYAGQWWLQSPVDVEAIFDAFRTVDGIQVDDHRLRVPIHEPDSAELTGEFLLYDASNGATTVSFYDFSRRRLIEIDIEELRYSYPAWRIRFWSPRTNPGEAPSYLKSSDPDLPANSTAQGGVEPSLATSAAVDASPSTELFENLRSFVEREREAERAKRRQTYASMRRQEFFKEFNGVRSVAPVGREVGDYGEQIVKLRISVDPDTDTVDVPGEYGLYPGSEIFIDRVDDGTGFPVEAELFDIDGRTLGVGVYWDSSNDKAAAEAAFGEDSEVEFVVAELVNPVPFDRQLDAISTVESDERKRTIVTGEKSLETEESSYAHVGGDLNATQQTAARNALRAEDVYCIHGPPGTGKTRTLTAIIRAAVDENLRVLACAHSNQAVDNLLVGSSTSNRLDPRSIHADAVEGELDITRVGSNSTNSIVEERYVDGDVWHADVVGATMSAASDLADDMFDITVIDEATQATIPSTFIPFTKAEKAVLAGDHKQLPPYHSDERQIVEQPEFSLFEHLIGLYGADRLRTTLTTQYRMHEDIAAFPNQAFYDGVLTHGQRNRRWTIGPLDPVVAYDVQGTEERTPGHSYFNRAEAEIVAKEVERLFRHGLLADEIGIITPYDGQIGIIRSQLNQELGASSAAEVKVDTIDSFQGGEREAVIVSFVRSNDEGEIGFLGFPVEGPRRLNVALTRAQKRLVLIGDWDTLTTESQTDGESATYYYQSLQEHLASMNTFADPPN
ncbi:AAA domain-containing protein [Halorubrum sp. AD140]|uniref:AAA domain-containing protein n=1 Tax=Halorubrum sp. AD140 TaxID=3050073 RepID=UPI002ACC65F9|nr:AAA domain-containing protein [Halorubrum sp. AD140]MDZ5811757.1 AAA domain-containing protein [Halorubrum sp. AD140]